MKINIRKYKMNLTLKDYDMNLHEYVEYIESSFINGQKNQAFNLFRQLDNEGVEEFLSYIDNVKLLKFILKFTYIGDEIQKDVFTTKLD